ARRSPRSRIRSSIPWACRRRERPPCPWFEPAPARSCRHSLLVSVGKGRQDAEQALLVELGDMVRKAGFLALLAGLLIRVAGQGDDRRLAPGALRLHALGEGEAVHLGHVEVADDDVKKLAG